MLTTLAISNYLSLLNLVIPLGKLNVITGVNGSGKSNLYRALRLLAETAQGGVVNTLAKEGGLESTFWAGPKKTTRGMLCLMAAFQDKEQPRSINDCAWAFRVMTLAIQFQWAC